MGEPAHLDRCECCDGRHNCLKQRLVEPLDRELTDARSELENLRMLQEQVNWFNFEIACLSWNWPWHPSYMMTPLILEGMRVTHTRKRGKRHELVEFPVWFSGTVWDAQQIPYAILANEIKEAEAYVERAEQNVNAPYEYAPGGALYEQLRRTTNLPTQV